ncbi:MAG: carbon-nitrogen hydrolase family protein [Gemmatimonadaceae bacterium]|nr:carbon-nitrogen hydrolase family protein [Gemmatimonadaceae bacterium]MCW5826804.1 carbon-nitrogen hydrolase family protein [Gemmatimonadaceae bacterium]
MDERIRVATLQYHIRQVETFDQFAAQVTGLVETAADYKCKLVLFPEYFTLQLLTLGDVRSDIKQQVRRLAGYVERYVELFSALTKKHKLYVCAGTIPVAEDDDIYNESFFFGPDGSHRVQPKLHMTRFENEEWIVKPRSRLKLFDTALGKVAIAICYDVQFPEIARAAARRGAKILLVPSCTDDRQGMLRVRYCAQARAIENQMFVITSHTVGSLPMVPAVSLNYGQAAILTPSDFPFARDGILAEGIPNQETMVIAELEMGAIQRARSSGTVLPLLDSERTASLVAEVDEESL